MSRIKPYIEVAVIVALLFTLGFILNPEDPFFNELKPCPYLLIVIIAAVKYGSPYGLVIGIVCAVLDLSTSIVGKEESIRDAIFLDPLRLLPMAVYIALGHFIGESIHSRVMRTEFFRNLADERKNLADSLAGEKTELENRYRRLEAKIATESKSSYSFIRYLMAFDGLDDKMIPEYSSEAVIKFTGAETVKYWVKNDGLWQQVYPDAEECSNKGVPQMLLKAEELNDWITCRDYPELAADEGVDLAMCYYSLRTDAVHAVTCSDIPFVEWGLQLKDRLKTILRESTAASDFWGMKYALEGVMPIEQTLMVESLRLFMNHVHKQLLTLRRSDSTSTLIFITLDRELAADIRILGIISSCLRSMLRVSDGISYDQDGNYFVVFLPQTEKKGAEIVVKKINHAMDTLGLRPGNKEIRLYPEYYEVTNAGMLDDVFADYKGRKNS